MKRRHGYYTKTEASEYLGIEKWVLDDLRDLDLWPSYVRIGKKIRYNKSVLYEWGTANLLWIH